MVIKLIIGSALILSINAQQRIKDGQTPSNRISRRDIPYL